MKIKIAYQVLFLGVLVLAVQSVNGAAVSNEDAELQQAILASLESEQQQHTMGADLDEESQSIILEYYAAQRAGRQRIRQAEIRRAEQERLDRAEAERLQQEFMQQAAIEEAAYQSGAQSSTGRHDQGTRVLARRAGSRTRYSADGIDVRARDAQGQTALHRACAQGTVADVRHLIEVCGADVNVRDNTGSVPLRTAWSYQNQEAIEYLTGLKVKMDAYNRVVIDWDHVATLSDRVSRSRIMRCKQLLCDGYSGELPQSVLVVAHSVLQELGMQQVQFFATQNASSFASDFAFQKIGVSPRSLEKARSAQYTSTYKALNNDAISFKRMLYHELCHIRGRHSTLSGVVYENNENEGDQILELSNELEAELGAMYYLFKIDGVATFEDYCEDEHHPSRADHHRYIAHLYSALLENPEMGFDRAIAPLVTQYVQEKRSCIETLPDVTRSVKVRLANVARESRYVDQWILC